MPVTDMVSSRPQRNAPESVCLLMCQNRFQFTATQPTSFSRCYYCECVAWCGLHSATCKGGTGQFCMLLLNLLRPHSAIDSAVRVRRVASGIKGTRVIRLAQGKLAETMGFEMEELTHSSAHVMQNQHHKLCDYARRRRAVVHCC